MKIVIFEGNPNRQGSSHIPAGAFAKGAKEAGNKTVTIWWRQAPRIISTFLKRCNLNGKTIVPFRTPASSGMGPSAANLRPLSGNASRLFGQRFSGSASRSTVENWVNGPGLSLTPAT